MCGQVEPDCLEVTEQMCFQSVSATFLVQRRKYHRCYHVQFAASELKSDNCVLPTKLRLDRQIDR